MTQFEVGDLLLISDSRYSIKDNNVLLVVDVYDSYAQGFKDQHARAFNPLTGRMQVFSATQFKHYGYPFLHFRRGEIVVWERY